MGHIHQGCAVYQQAVQLLEQALGEAGEGRGEEGGIHCLYCKFLFHPMIISSPRRNFKQELTGLMI